MNCVRLVAQSKGEGVVEGGVRPRVDEDRREECLRTIWWIRGPLPVRENFTVERFKGGGDAQVLVDWTKVLTPQLQACSLFGK